MRSVALPGTEATTSALGFGCSALVGGRTTREALRLLETAFDAGIRHFDVARVYGTGDAEAIVGRFAATRREEITIASKFGIDPLRTTAAFTALKRTVRVATRRSRGLLRLARRHSGRTIRRGLFTGEKARSSLGVSLRALGTSYVDVFLLHDCTSADWQQDDILDALDELASRGGLRCFGTATSFAETRAVFAAPGRNPAVAQFEADVLAPNASLFGAEGDRALAITHGCFRRTLPALLEFFAGNAGKAAEWSEAVDVDMSSPEVIAGLLLCATLASNPSGIVLFSSGDPRKIERNARLAAEMPYDAAQLQEFSRRVRAALTATQ